METLEWADRYVLGIERMDVTHREFIDFYNELSALAPRDEGFLGRFDAFIDHTDAHFEQENRWMAATNFPSCHREEHDRVLGVIRDVRQRVAAGDFFLGKRLLEELRPWFDNHVDTMDAALAFYLKEIGFDTECGVSALPTRGTAPQHRCEGGGGATGERPA